MQRSADRLDGVWRGILPKYGGSDVARQNLGPQEDQQGDTEDRQDRQDDALPKERQQNFLDLLDVGQPGGKALPARLMRTRERWPLLGEPPPGRYLRPIELTVTGDLAIGEFLACGMDV